MLESAASYFEGFIVLATFLLKAFFSRRGTSFMIRINPDRKRQIVLEVTKGHWPSLTPYAVQSENPTTVMMYIPVEMACVSPVRMIRHA
jgi:hypothetical protein